MFAVTLPAAAAPPADGAERWTWDEPAPFEAVYVLPSPAGLPAFVQRRTLSPYPDRANDISCFGFSEDATLLLLVGDDGPNVTVTREHAKGDAAIRGQAEELLLWIWGRPGQVELFGDADVAAAWRALAP